MLLENLYINNTYLQRDGAWSGGLELFDGRQHSLRNCLIDLSEADLAKMDEALSFSWGCFGEVENCVIRGAGKLVLLGSGDADKLAVEKGTEVFFKNCIFENFSRRAPEVQDGMRAILKNCLIRNWGHADRFSVRSFGGWAHTPGSFIYAENVIFRQEKFFAGRFWQDLIGHVGQAVNDSGLRGLLGREAWLPGVCRGLVATCKGHVRARHCHKNRWWIAIENHTEPMSDAEARELENNLENMRKELYARLGLEHFHFENAQPAA